MEHERNFRLTNRSEFDDRVKTMKSKKSAEVLMVLLTIQLVFYGGRLSSAQQNNEIFQWYKGNTHTHTLNSDGDTAPDEVVRWYREHGYHFLVITDHDYFTNVDGLNALIGAEEQFIVIKGIEASDSIDSKSIHINGLNPGHYVLPQKGTSVVDTIQKNVDAIRDAGGVPHIDHPNYMWSITADDLKQITNCKLFELFSGHPRINNYGGGGLPSVEEIWDEVLSSEKLIYGLAVDDAHAFKEPWNKNVARPGQGWIMVRSEHLTAEALLEAMERGDFYSSTGVEIEKYQVDESSLSITIKESGTTKYRTQFIGKNGEIFKEDISNPATYTFKGDEMYIRAKIIDSNGRKAWTQPVMVKSQN
jgi:hypothetical protein